MELSVAAGKEQKGRAAGAQPERGKTCSPALQQGFWGQQGTQGTWLPLAS